MRGCFLFQFPAVFLSKARVCFRKTKIKHWSELYLHSCANAFLFLLVCVNFWNLIFISLCSKNDRLNAAWKKEDGNLNSFNYNDLLYLGQQETRNDCICTGNRTLLQHLNNLHCAIALEIQLDVISHFFRVCLGEESQMGKSEQAVGIWRRARGCAWTPRHRKPLQGLTPKRTKAPEVSML